jgi:hypothetical protein
VREMTACDRVALQGREVPGGYCLRVRPGERDTERFERQVADGRLAAGRGAEERYAEGLHCWIRT